MNTDRLGKLLEAHRLAVDERRQGSRRGTSSSGKGKFENFHLGGGEAAPDPWPDTVRSASKKLDTDLAAAWQTLADALCLPAVRSSDEWRNQPDPDPVIWRDHARFFDAVLSSGEVAVLGRGGQVWEILPRRGAGCCGGSREDAWSTTTGKPADCG